MENTSDLYEEREENINDEEVQINDDKITYTYNYTYLNVA